jgi:hypothetical protein
MHFWLCMKRFSMTSDGFHFWTPVILLPILLAQFVSVLLFGHKLPGPVAGPVLIATVSLVMILLLVTTLLTPTAVRLGVSALEVERWFWPSFVVPYADLTGVEDGPISRVFASDVGRVAGVGGWFWSGGLFRARGVGLVRAWLRRLGPTVVVRRASGLPMLFGLDDPEGFRTAIAAKIH